MTEHPNVTIAGDDGVVVASLSGEIDLSNATEITHALLGGVPNEALGLVIDLSEVSYLDSAGVRMLAELDHRLGWRAQALRVVAPETSRSRRVLEIAGSGAGALDGLHRGGRPDGRPGLERGT